MSSSTARRRTLRIAAAALTAAAGLTLTACTGADATDAKPADKTDTSAAAPESGGAGTSAGTQGTDAQAGKQKPGSGNATPSRAGSGNGAAKGSGKTAFCRTNDLTMAAANSSPDQKTGDVTVRMTNKGASTCSAAGFAGVDLKDIDGTSAPVHRGREVPRITDLKPGDTATFSISYKVDFSGDSIASPTHIIVTPPNETHSVSLKWPAEALKLAGPYDDKIQVHPVGIAN
ncbi:DUF4232 domain-containing protein [Streptomyces sp. NPDC101227]|uniref:DUF4232 domain-containing protein n=1 Tax=Streptomyces sp. NPDC101227 TaxID=3366136 RepID=UPI00380572F7